MPTIFTRTSISLAIATASYASAAVAQQDNTDAIEKISVVHKQAYRGSIPDNELPQALESFSLSDIAPLNLTRFQDVLDYSGTIARQNNGGGLWDSFSLRGFPGNENMPSGYLINGFNGGRGFSGHRDLSNVQSIEILKGPGSALYGRSEPGGIINIVTKKPQFSEQGSIKASAGRFDQYRVEGDYTNAISDDVAFRINGAWQDFGSFRDYVSSDKQVITPSVTWKINDTSNLLYEFEYVKQEQLFDRGIVVLDNNFDTVPRERYLGNPADGPTEIYAVGHHLAYQTELANNWSLLAGYSYRRSDLNGFSSDAELSASRQTLYEDGETLTRQHRRRDYASEDHSVRLELSGDVDIAGMTHRMMMGMDAYDYEVSTALFRYRGGANTYTLNINEPDYGDEFPPVDLLYQDNEEQQSFGAYIQDQIGLTDKLKMLVGVRFDTYSQDIGETLTGRFNEASDSRLSPRFGLTYLLNDTVTLYTSYSEGFIPLSGTDAAGNAFDPEESQSVEAGIKYASDALSMTLAVFDAQKTNILTSDPVNVGFSAALGEATSQGVEFDADWNMTADTQLILSYAWLNTQTGEAAVNPDWGILVPEGSPLVNVPKHNISVRMNHFFELAGQQAQTGLSVRYVDDRLGDSVNLDYRLPSYTLVGWYGKVNLTNQLSFELNIDNVLDEEYYTSSYSPLWTVPGEPRNARVTLNYQF